MINNPTHLQIVDTEFLQNEIERQQSFLLYKTIFSLNETNIKTSVKTTISLIDSEYTFSFNKMICRLIYSAFLSRMNQEEIYFQYLNLLQDQIKQIKRNDKGIFEILSEILLNIHSNESYYLLEKMIQQKYIKTKMIQEQDFPIYKEVSNNDNEIHNQLILEGVNPNEISKIIRNDEIEKLQEITSQNNFNFNQMIKPSVYERFSFINKENIPLINYAAFFGSIECFKYLLLNGAKLKNTGKYAIAGGNLEIIHLCEQNHSSFEDAYETSIEFHRNDIFKYLYDNNILSQYNLNEMSYKSIFYNNYEILLFFEREGLKINNRIIRKLIMNDNIILIKLYLKRKNKFNFMKLYQYQKLEIMKLILSQEGIDINLQDKKGNTSLMQIIKDNRKGIFNFLVEQNKIDFNIQNNNGETALMIASQKGNIQFLKKILEYKTIDINIKNKDGETAFMIGCKYNQYNIVKELLEQDKIDINSKNNIGTTALMIVCDYNHYNIVKLLLDQKQIDINAKDNDEETALIYAVFKGNTEIVKILLEQKGIDINNKNDFFFII